MVPNVTSESRFKTLFEQATLPMEIYSLDGFCLAANEAWEKLFEVSRYEQTGYNIHKNSQLKKMGLDDYFRQAYSGAPVNIPLFFYDPKIEGRPGRARWVEIYLFPVKDNTKRVTELAMILNDVSAQKEIELALRQSRDNLRVTLSHLDFVLKSVDIGFWHSDLPLKKLVWDAKVKEQFGLPPDAQPSMEFFLDRLHPHDRDRIEEAMITKVLSSEPFTEEYRTLHPDTGEVRWIRAVGQTFSDQHSGTKCFDGITIDITKQKSAEENLKRIAEEAHSAVQARDEFVSIASHELRTPLTSMKLQIQALKRSLERGDDEALSRERVLKTIEQSDRQIHRLTRLVEDMLDISRVNTGKLQIVPERIELRGLMRDALERLNPQIVEAGCQFKEILNSDRTVYWDRYRIEQVLINLVTNALRYGDGKPVEISLEDKEGFVILRVKDQGQGIAPSNHGRIFQRFERAGTNNNAGGLGLGLYIVKQIVEMHHGSISVRSDLGRGSLFEILLPNDPFGISEQKTL